MFLPADLPGLDDVGYLGHLLQRQIRLLLGRLERHAARLHRLALLEGGVRGEVRSGVRVRGEVG